jgi:hypothetical protein
MEGGAWFAAPGPRGAAAAATAGGKSGEAPPAGEPQQLRLRQGGPATHTPSKQFRAEDLSPSSHWRRTAQMLEMNCCLLASGADLQGMHCRRFFRRYQKMRTRCRALGSDSVFHAGLLLAGRRGVGIWDASNSAGSAPVSQGATAGQKQIPKDAGEGKLLNAGLSLSLATQWRRRRRRRRGVSSSAITSSSLLKLSPSPSTPTRVSKWGAARGSGQTNRDRDGTDGSESGHPPQPNPVSDGRPRRREPGLDREVSLPLHRSRNMHC